MIPRSLDYAVSLRQRRRPPPGRSTRPGRDGTELHIPPNTEIARRTGTRHPVARSAAWDCDETVAAHLGMGLTP